MKKSQLPERSVYIITEYYKNNIQYFLDSLSKNCLWIGPAQGQMIHTKQALVEAFSQEDNQLTFAMRNLQVIPIPVNATSLDVVLTYTVASYYPDGEELIFQQRTELLWVEEREKDETGTVQKTYRIRVCHVSNEFPYDTRDTIYPNHFTELEIAKIYTGRMSLCRFALKGPRNTFFYLSGDTILWMESKGVHTMIHTVDQVYESIEKLSDIVAKYPDTLCKVHASYAVNPLYVAELGRFYVQMEDGTRISIPEKKYTRVRDRLHEMLDSLRER